MAEQQRIAIVGAGLAGLSAALELKDAGAYVELFERSRLLGGRATSFTIDGHEVDNGQHVFLGCCSAFIAFAERTGMGRHLHLQDRFDALVVARDGSIGRLRTANLPAPLHLLPSFARYRHLSWTGKLRIARALAGVVTGGGTPAVKTFEDWLVATGQDAETRRAFWDPFFIPALNAPFDRIDNADAMFVLKTAFIEDASAARFGFSTVPLAHLAAAAAQRLDAVHLSTAVVGIDPGLERGVTLQLLGDRCAAFDAVVVAVPPRVLAKLLGDAGAYGIEGLDAFDPFPIVDVHLWHDGPSMGFDFAAALESPLQWIFEKQTGYLCCSFSAADEYVRFTNDELQALAWREVQTYVGALRGSSLLRGAVTRNPEATYLPRLGVQRPGQTTLRPAVAIAGAWTQTGWPDTMESAVRSGIAAAEALGAAPRGYGEHAAGAVAVGATP